MAGDGHESQPVARCSALTNWATKSHSWEQVNLLVWCFPVKGISYERNVIWSAVFENTALQITFLSYEILFTMFTTAMCAIFLVNLRWPKSKSLYDVAIWVPHRRTLSIFVIFRGFSRGFLLFLGALVGRLAGISPRFHVVKITGIPSFLTCVLNRNVPREALSTS